MTKIEAWKQAAINTGLPEKFVQNYINQAKFPDDCSKELSEQEAAEFMKDIQADIERKRALFIGDGTNKN